MNYPIEGEYTYSTRKRTNQVLPGGVVEYSYAILIKAQDKVIATMHPILEHELPSAEATAKLICNAKNVLAEARNVIEQVDPCQSLNASQRDAMQKLNKVVLTSSL